MAVRAYKIAFLNLMLNRFFRLARPDHRRDPTNFSGRFSMIEIHAFWRKLSAAVGTRLGLDGFDPLSHGLFVQAVCNPPSFVVILVVFPILLGRFLGVRLNTSLTTFLADATEPSGFRSILFSIFLEVIARFVFVLLTAWTEFHEHKIEAPRTVCFEQVNF